MNLNSIVTLYENGTCVKINVNKSSISFFGTEEIDRVFCLNLFPFRVENFAKVTKYLGFHIRIHNRRGSLENWKE